MNRLEPYSTLGIQILSPICTGYNSSIEILSIIYVVLLIIKISVYYESIWPMRLVNNVLEVFLFYMPLYIEEVVFDELKTDIRTLLNLIPIL